MAYFPLGGLLPRPPPDGLPVWLGPLAGVELVLRMKFGEIMIFLFGELKSPGEEVFRLQTCIENQLHP